MSRCRGGVRKETPAQSSANFKFDLLNDVLSGVSARFIFPRCEASILCVVFVFATCNVLRKSILRLEAKRAQVTGLFAFGSLVRRRGRLCDILRRPAALRRFSLCCSDTPVGVLPIRVEDWSSTLQRMLPPKVHAVTSTHSRERHTQCHACTHVERKACLHTYSVGQTE